MNMNCKHCNAELGEDITVCPVCGKEQSEVKEDASEMTEETLVETAAAEVVFQTLYACIKESMGKNSFGSSIDFDREGVPDIPAFGSSWYESHPVSEPQPGLDPTYNPFDNDGFHSVDSPFSNVFPSDADGTKGGRQPFSYMPAGAGLVDRRDDYGKLFEDKISPSKSVLVLGGKYIITTSSNGLMMINAQRAMERILYDRFLAAMSGNVHVTQTALFPVTIQVGVENMCQSGAVILEK